MKKYKLFIGFVLLLIANTLTHAQCTGWNALQTSDSTFTNPAFGITTSPEIDKLKRGFTYVATVSGGVKIYDNNATGNPTVVATVAKTALGNLDAINLFQDSIWLYVCLGNIWNTNEMAGLAIVNVSNPAAPAVLDVYSHNGLGGGSGAVTVRGNYAYLAANQNGLVVLDISNKNNIQLTGTLTLSNNFPHTNVGSSTMYNARGIGLKGNYAYVCYDRGGLRVIDISNPASPVQINQYCYLPLINKTTAYNNVVIYKNMAFVTIDYYGMEILDITNPNSISQLGWWHPAIWADTTNNYNTWSNSKGHANEIAYDSICKKIYLAAGKTDAVAIDVSNPANPVTCETFGSATDAYGTWGLDFFNSKIGIAYIWSVAFPPYSNYTGFKILQTSCTSSGLPEKNSALNHLTLSPNPTSDMLHINLYNQHLKAVKVFSVTGELVQSGNTMELSLKNLPAGLYIVVTETNETQFVNKIVKD